MSDEPGADARGLTANGSLVTVHSILGSDVNYTAVDVVLGYDNLNVIGTDTDCPDGPFSHAADLRQCRFSDDLHFRIKQYGGGASSGLDAIVPAEASTCNVLASDDATLEHHLEEMCRTLST